MKVYDFPYAPNPQKLRVYLAEKGLNIQKVTVNITRGENRTPEFLSKNPMGSLPVLELDDGTCLTESLAIIEYFEDLYPDPNMIGETPLERARVRELERLAEMSILSRVARYFFHKSPYFASFNQVSEIAEYAIQGLPNALAIMDNSIGQNEFVAGSVPSIADCTLFAALEHAKRANLELHYNYNNLSRWYNNFLTRPSAKA